ncbi:hypothetical protein PDE_02439 [Penicillium oxalicum 114-2]|uniref:Uncharacterized protein n=1 Tax=Penicillium oxalicum (strain 114-2 / CGMCC 5302) TaxID=933388 RepID=S7ZFR0_PENO1|nr:hypothetical protein PDE_02439 [Penicillium oxalicum 114-2]
MSHLQDEHDPDDDGETPRKGWKRLTTKEEVTLFEICNRHANSFGRRSDLCNWWKTVAAEFSHANGRPYSWHSVRRKVESSTKRRIQFLRDQQQRQRDLSGVNSVTDVMNPQWCAVLDAWIPTWQNWEQAEVRRIARRDMLSRKRSRSKIEKQYWASQVQMVNEPEQFDLTSPTSPGDTGVEANDPYEGPIVLVTRSPEPPAAPVTSTSTQPAPASPNVETPSNTGSTIGVRLPPGFDTMFSNSPSHSQSHNHWPPVYPTTPRPEPESSVDRRMVGAVLETLGKLNRHLDSVSSNGALADARASPVISALAQPTSNSAGQNRDTPAGQRQSPSNNLPPVDLERMKEQLRQELKEEFRQEMQEQLRRDRAGLESRLDAVQRTQEMILEMLRQEPA